MPGRSNGIYLRKNEGRGAWKTRERVHRRLARMLSGGRNVMSGAAARTGRYKEKEEP